MKKKAIMNPDGPADYLSAILICGVPKVKGDELIYNGQKYIITDIKANPKERSKQITFTLRKV